jgi:uncharacterized lipoprotein YbaY
VTHDPGTRAVRGRIALPPEIPAEKARAVVVQVEDVSRMDAPSEVLAQQRFENVDLEEGGELPFEVQVPADLVDQRRRYSMRVHVDVNGTGNVTKGDYVSTASYPVLTEGDDDFLVITARRV